MNFVLFAKMDQVFSKDNKTLKKNLENVKRILEKSGNFVSPEKWEPCNFNAVFNWNSQLTLMKSAMLYLQQMMHLHHIQRCHLQSSGTVGYETSLRKVLAQVQFQEFLKGLWIIQFSRGVLVFLNM